MPKPKAYPLQDWDAPANEGTGYHGATRLTGGAPVGEESDDDRGGAIDDLADVLNEQLGVDRLAAGRIAQACVDFWRARQTPAPAPQSQSVHLLGQMLTDMAADAPLFGHQLWVMAAALECDEAQSLRKLGAKLKVSHECIAKRIAKFRARYNLPESRMSHRHITPTDEIPCQKVDRLKITPENASRVLPKTYVSR